MRRGAQKHQCMVRVGQDREGSTRERGQHQHTRQRQRQRDRERQRGTESVRAGRRGREGGIEGGREDATTSDTQHELTCPVVLAKQPARYGAEMPAVTPMKGRRATWHEN